jgi:hypothetical protein
LKRKGLREGVVEVIENKGEANAKFAGWLQARDDDTMER